MFDSAANVIIYFVSTKKMMTNLQEFTFIEIKTSFYLAVIDKFRIFAAEIKNSSINPESKVQIMIERLLNLKTFQKITLTLTTLLLVPNAALAEEKTYTMTIFTEQSGTVSSWGNSEVGYYYWEKSTTGNGTIDLSNASQWIIGANTSLILKLNSFGQTPSSTSEFSITDCFKAATLSFNETTNKYVAATGEPNANVTYYKKLPVIGADIRGNRQWGS